MGSFVFNNSITGGQNQINQGQTVNATQSNGVQLPTVKQVLDTVSEAIPPEAVEDTIQPLMAMSELPAEEQATEEKKEEAKNLWARLEPYKGTIYKGVSALGISALTMLVPGAPVLAPLLAMMQAIKPKETE